MNKQILFLNIGDYLIIPNIHAKSDEYKEIRYLKISQRIYPQNNKTIVSIGFSSLHGVIFVNYDWYDFWSN